MSTLFLVRGFTFLILPLLLAGAVILLDKRVSSRERQIEIVLIYLFSLGAANGISGAMGHLFASDIVAESIGWATGSPFQLEIGFANLAIGVLAAMSVPRRDGLREATVVAGSIFSIGAFMVHMIDMVQHGNFSPGNTLINITNLGRPALLIFFLWAARRIEASRQSESHSVSFANWRGFHAHLGGTSGAMIGTGLGIGMAMNQPLFGLIGGLLSTLIFAGLATRKSRPSQPVSSAVGD